MITAFKRIVEDFDHALGESRNIIVLTDSAGTVISVCGHRVVREAGEDIHLVPGSLWDESKIGTNAIGTAIALKHPIQVHALEHYCEGVKAWTCSAAQIQDPIDGEVLGVVDISGSDDTFHAYSLALAVSIARQIETELSMQDRNDRQKLKEWYRKTRFHWQSDEMVLLDHKGRIIETSENAAKALSDMGLNVELRAGAHLLTLGRGEKRDEYYRTLPSQMDPEWLKPFNAEGEWEGGVLILPVHRHVKRGQGKGEQGETGGDTEPFPDIIGQCQQILDLKRRVHQISGISAPVLVLGETGCGKELFAKAIHETSQCADGPFVPINCGALSKDLIVSELFGYEGGAFTGAHSAGRVGKFESADGGTLFLDEIGELPHDAQTSLLRVLQDNIVVRVGSNKERKVNVRIIAATNRDLRAEIAAGRFREDLYYRLKVIALNLPPLRDRDEDIDLLVSYFLEQFSQQYRKPVPMVDDRLKAAFHVYTWPGNVRELRSVLESMFVFNMSDTLGLSDLPNDISETLPQAVFGAKNIGEGHLYAVERKAILAEISRQGGNLTKVAQGLGIARSTLYKKIEKYGLTVDRC
jgi:transcriptional regulator of acetoin/glycerol metabolism